MRYCGRGDDTLGYGALRATLTRRYQGTGLATLHRLAQMGTIQPPG